MNRRHSITPPRLPCRRPWRRARSSPARHRHMEIVYMTTIFSRKSGLFTFAFSLLTSAFSSLRLAGGRAQRHRAHVHHRHVLHAGRQSAAAGDRRSAGDRDAAGLHTMIVERRSLDEADHLDELVVALLDLVHDLLLAVDPEGPRADVRTSLNVHFPPLDGREHAPLEAADHGQLDGILRYLRAVLSLLAGGGGEQHGNEQGLQGLHRSLLILQGGSITIL